MKLKRNPVKYQGVSLPLDFINEIKSSIKNDSMYRNVPEFVKVATREKLQGKSEKDQYSDSIIRNKTKLLSKITGKTYVTFSGSLPGYVEFPDRVGLYEEKNVSFSNKGISKIIDEKIYNITKQIDSEIDINEEDIAKITAVVVSVLERKKQNKKVTEDKKLNGHGLS